MEKWNNKYNIESSRLRFHDYSGGIYHIVICTKERMNLLGDIVKINNQNVIEYQEIGIYLNDCISKLTNHCPYAIPILWQVMPNHVHILLQIDKEKVPYQRKSEYDLEKFELSRDARSRVLDQEEQKKSRRDARSRVLDNLNSTSIPYLPKNRYFCTKLSL